MQQSEAPLRPSSVDLGRRACDRPGGGPSPPLATQPGGRATSCSATKAGSVAGLRHVGRHHDPAVAPQRVPGGSGSSANTSRRAPRSVALEGGQEIRLDQVARRSTLTRYDRCPIAAKKRRSRMPSSQASGQHGHDDLRVREDLSRPAPPSRSGYPPASVASDSNRRSRNRLRRGGALPPCRASRGRAPAPTSSAGRAAEPPRLPLRVAQRGPSPAPGEHRGEHVLGHVVDEVGVDEAGQDDAPRQAGSASRWSTPAP